MSALLRTVIARYTTHSNERVRERLAEGLWRKAQLIAAMNLATAHAMQQETARDPGEGLVAATSEQAGDRAETVLGA